MRGIQENELACHNVLNHQLRISVWAHGLSGESLIDGHFGWLAIHST